jgi:hypothetical protein
MTTPQDTQVHVIHYSVDDEPQETSERTLTAEQILRNAGLDPATHYLVQLEGAHQVSYKDNPSATIHLHEHQRFVSNALGPTPVS